MEIVTFRSLDCFNLGSNHRVEMVTIRSLECDIIVVEDRVEVITLSFLECFNCGQKTWWEWLH